MTNRVRAWVFIMLAVIMLAIPIAPLIMMPYWHQLSRPARDAFIAGFLESIRDDTAFYRRVLVARDWPVAEKVRPLLSGPFLVLNWDGPFMDDECLIRLQDGSRLSLFVLQRKHQVQEVTMFHHPASSGAEPRANPANNVSGLLPQGGRLVRVRAGGGFFPGETTANIGSGSTITISDDP